ncbi:hypothetical protein BT69DRAFT_1327792 [Atractiella rhizophila]|nr:hypothetical protein BT69DRAFT_1327792 [Atractiella rhizophila]
MKDEDMQSRQKLTPAQEDAIVEICNFCKRVFYPVTKQYIINFVKELYIETHPEESADGLSICGWYEGFMKGHPEFANQVARWIGKERINILYPELEKWWEELGKAWEEYGIVDADQVNCVNGKGFMLEVSQKEHVVVRSKDQVKNPQFIRDGNHEWVTVN